MRHHTHTNLSTRVERLALLLGIVLGLALGAGCATVFTGEAHFGGPDKCFTLCKRYNMKMSGYVFMGQYSSACVCEVKGRKASKAALLRSATGAVSGAAAGVVMQMRREAAQKR